ncbi:MAG: membrane protein insertion efficiency factor YidD [Anaeroplasmataceae bacterium]
MKKLILKLIDNYQRNISPNKPKRCRFIPTCSEYAKTAYNRFNFFYASFLTIKRLIKCNPFHKMAYDPVPEEKRYRYKYDTLEDALIKTYYESYHK